MGPILIAGCGKLGNQLAQLPLASWQRPPTFWGIKRTAHHLEPAIHLLQADLNTSDLKPMLAHQPWHTVIFTATPKASSEEDYVQVYLQSQQRLLTALADRQQPLQRYLFISSTAVFGQDGGQWLDDDSPTSPQPFRGTTLLAAEQLAATAPAQACVAIRLGGIYDGQTHMLGRFGPSLGHGPDASRWINRIHRTDAARIIQFVSQHPAPSPSYIGVDLEPASTATVVAWITGQSAPPLPQAGKRCRPKRLLEQGFVHLYPSYKQGYPQR